VEPVGLLAQRPQHLIVVLQHGFKFVMCHGPNLKDLGEEGLAILADGVERVDLIALAGFLLVSISVGLRHY